MSSSNGTNTQQQLIVVSNRLPVSLTRDSGGGWSAQPASGGLVHALKDVIDERGGKWFGWAGVAGNDGVDQVLQEVSSTLPYSLEPVSLTEQQVEDYYFGFSNEVIWPLFHDMVSRCKFEPRYWHSYQEVNALFAKEIAAKTEDDQFIWVQDYHLMLVGHLLRAVGAKRRVAYFLHIPFPPIDVFVKLPWRFQILQGLLGFDTIGFQTVRDTENFIRCVRNMLAGVQVRRHEDVYIITIFGREVRVGNFPIGIDFMSFDTRARSDAVTAATRLLQERLPDRQLILGIDRLDYTKGIPERLYAYQDALRRYPDLIGATSLVQVVVPSREIVAGYRSMKEQVERLVSEINGEFTRPGWVPVHYLFRSLSQTELISYYRAAQISLVTPIKDGMNLISKEYAAANVDLNGSLVLSEFAGSAAQLHQWAIMVNPYHVVGAADAIYRAFSMNMAEREMRMTEMRKVVKDTSVFWWTNGFLSLAIDGNHQLRPRQSFFVPNWNVNEPAPYSDVIIIDEDPVESN